MMFTNTTDDGGALDCAGPTDVEVEALRAVQDGFAQAQITRAEVVAAVFTKFLTPVDPVDIPTGDAFFPDPGMNPNALAGGGVLPVGCVRVPGVGVVRVVDVERLVHDVPVELECVLATVLDCLRTQVTARLRDMVTLTVLMPNMWAHVRDGGVSFDRAAYAAYRVSRTSVDVPEFDRRLAQRRTDVGIKTFRKYVAEILAILRTPDTVNEDAHENRRVRLYRGVGGESTIAITGPTLVLEAAYARFTGFARSIQKNLLTHVTGHPAEACGPECTHPPACDCARCAAARTNGVVPTGDEGVSCAGNASTGGNTLARGFGDVEVEESRLFDQLVFDSMIGARPSTVVTARLVDTGTQAPTRVHHADPVQEGGVPVRVEDRWDASRAQSVVERKLCVSMPTSEEWLKTQASINLMIPLMHLLPNNSDTSTVSCGPHGHGGAGNIRMNDPPGASASAGRGGVPVMLNNQVPLDPYTTDMLLKESSWVYRYFTDPTTGTVAEILPTRYRVPTRLKHMLEARWETCSVPWCSTPARVCEKDHIQPFNHRDPANGGLTVAENLHPLCKRHHQAKTEGRISVTRTVDGGVEWEFPAIGTILSYPPESLVQQHNYQRL